MMKQQSHNLYVAAMRKSVRVSPIVAFYRSACSQPSTFRRKGLAPARCFCAMGLLQPADVLPNWLDDAVAQTQASTRLRLEAVRECRGIRVQEEIGEDLHRKVQLQSYNVTKFNIALCPSYKVTMLQSHKVTIVQARLFLATSDLPPEDAQLFVSLPAVRRGSAAGSSAASPSCH